MTGKVLPMIPVGQAFSLPIDQQPGKMARPMSGGQAPRGGRVARSTVLGWPCVSSHLQLHVQATLERGTRGRPATTGGRRFFAAVCLGLIVSACTAGEAKPKVVSIGKVRAYINDKRVEVDGTITHAPGVMIEVFACTPSGKTHETVITCECVPSNLHAALLLIGLKNGKPVSWGQKKKLPPTGDPVKISVRWTKDGKERTVRAEDLLYNVKAKRTMKHQYWVFSGSIMDANSKTPYIADVAGNLVTTYNDAATVIDNPTEAGVDDDMLEINGKVCPKPGTKVTLILEPGPKPKE